MSNTYLMSPFTGDFFDKSLEDLIQPLQAVSNLKDVRSVGLNINDYLNNLDRLGKIDLDQPTPLMPESQTGKKYARGFSAVDLYSKNIGTTRRTPTHRPPSILIPSLVIVQDEIPEDGDVLPYEGMKPNIFQANRLSDLHKTANFVKTEAKGDVAIRINSKSKYVNTAANSQNNVASIDQVAKFDKNQMVPSHAKESYLDEPSSAFRNKMMNPNLNLNRMGIFEEVCGGDELTRGNRKGRNNSNISEKKAGFEGFSATLVKLRLQSNNEIEELFLRMNSTARQLMQ